MTEVENTNKFRFERGQRVYYKGDPKGGTIHRQPGWVVVQKSVGNTLDNTIPVLTEAPPQQRIVVNMDLLLLTGPEEEKPEEPITVAELHPTEEEPKNESHAIDPEYLADTDEDESDS